MQRMGLGKADHDAYIAALWASYTMDVELRVLNLSGDLITSLRPELQSGQVNIDADSPVTRSATLGYQDATGSLQFNTDSPADGAVYFDNMVQVRHTIYVPALLREVSCDVFTGPITKFDRTADLVSIEAQGKEALALEGCPPLTLKRNAKAVDAIRTILTERVGESRFAFPDSNARLPKAVTVGWDEKVWPWTVCKRIARSIGMQLYYDGAGVCRLRRLPSASDPVVVFKTGKGGNITADVQVSHDKGSLRNQVLVVGHKPTIRATAALPAWHPASSSRLKRNGVRLWMRETITDDKITTKRAAQDRADAAMDDYLRLTFGTTFNALPVPPLDELDPIRIHSDQYVGTDRVHQASYSITGGDMTVGWNDLVSVPKKARRKH